MLLESQDSCIINAIITTSYFNLEKGDLVSAYLFILYLEVLVLLVEINHKIRGKNIFLYTYLYKACADGKTFFEKQKLY